MKNQIKIIGIALIIFGSLSSCKKKDEVVPVNNQPANSITVGMWKIGSFKLNGIEHGDLWSNYTFSFDKSGIVKAKSSEKEVIGIWSTATFEGRPSYHLNFGKDEPFSLLNSDRWEVIMQDDVKLDLRATRGDDGNQSVTFNKLPVQ